MITVESAMAAAHADTDADSGVAVALAVNLFCFMARNIARAPSPSAFIQVDFVHPKLMALFITGYRVV